VCWFGPEGEGDVPLWFEKMKESGAYKFSERYWWVVGVGMIAYGLLQLVFRF